MNALPDEYRRLLHPSQICRYQHQFDIKEYFGHELLNLSIEVLDTCRRINQQKLDRKVVKAYLRLSLTVRNIFSTAKNFHKTIHAAKDQIVETVQRVQHLIPVDKCAQLIGVCTSTLRNWITSVRVRCSGSVINLCRRVHPQQLSDGETNAMHKLLKNEQFIHWPLISLYYHALRNKIVTMSLSTWYKYAGLLAVNRLKPRSIKHYSGSVMATAPDQYWHADVTYFKTGDSVLHYIYLVTDNFSKMILAWAVSTKLCAKIRADTFRQALKTAVTYHADTATINLVVDGGSENNNTTVNDFLNSIDTIEIHKIRALKDVGYSNAHAEAINKTLKIYYLNQMDITGTECLQKKLTMIIEDYNQQRPHGRIAGLTPLECYTGKTIDTAALALQFLQARSQRIISNRMYFCPTCKF